MRKRRKASLSLLPFVAAVAAVSSQARATCARPLVPYRVSVEQIACAGPQGPVPSPDLAGEFCARPLGVGPNRMTAAQVCAAIDHDTREKLYLNRWADDAAVCPKGTVWRARFHAPEVSCEGTYGAAPAGLALPKEVAAALEACWVRQEGTACALYQVLNGPIETEMGAAPIAWKEVERKPNARCRDLFEDVGAGLSVIRPSRFFSSAGAVECSDPRVKVWYDPARE